MMERLFQLKVSCGTGVCPRGAQVRTRVGRVLNPLSSMKTMVRLCRRVLHVTNNLSPYCANLNKNLKPEVLESQCIPTDRRLWEIAHAVAFWSARRDLLASSFNDFLRDSLPQRRLGFY